MAQHDYSIANQSGSSFRADLNNALSAVVSQNSGSAAPTTMFAYQMWADTTAGVMKLRNGANSAWITLYELDGTFVTTDIKLGLGTAAAPSLTFTGDLNTGIYSPGADRVAITTGGTGRLFVDASGNVGVGTGSPAESLHTTGNIRFSLAGFLGEVGAGPYDIQLGPNPGSTFSVARNLAFFTNVGSGVSSERVRIDSSGRLLVGTTSNSGGATIQAIGSVQASIALRFPANNKNGGTTKPTAIETISTDGGNNTATVYANNRYGSGKWVFLAGFDTSGNAINSTTSASSGATFVFCITDAATNFPTT